MKYFGLLISIVLLLSCTKANTETPKEEADTQTEPQVFAVDVKDLEDILITGTLQKEKIIGMHFTHDVANKLASIIGGYSGYAVWDKEGNPFRSIYVMRLNNSVLFIISSRQADNDRKIINAELIKLRNENFSQEEATADREQNRKEYESVHFGFVYWNNEERMGLDQYDVFTVPDVMVTIDFQTNTIIVMDTPSDRYTVYFEGM